jgi:hypothetical protein
VDLPDQSPQTLGGGDVLAVAGQRRHGHIKSLG